MRKIKMLSFKIMLKLYEPQYLIRVFVTKGYK